MLDNARFGSRISGEHGGFGKFNAQWLADDLAGSWNKLSGEGSGLGGMPGPRFLRNVGKDTCMFSSDVVKARIATGVINKAPTSNTALATCNRAVSQWHEQSGRSWYDCHVLRLEQRGWPD